MKQDRLKYKIATAYYEKRLTQQEIANKYGVSRIKVSRLLSKAVQDGIVQIKIMVPEEQFTGLEHQLEEKYGLSEVIVVDVKSESEGDILDFIGKAAADYLISSLEGNEIVGVTWGRTFLQVVNHLSVQNFPDLKVVQMLGGLGEPAAEYHGTDLTRRMAQMFNSRPVLIHSPGILKSKALCDELKQDIQVKNALDLSSEADLAVVGIGLFSAGNSLLKSSPILSEEDKKVLIQSGAIGDISLRFFNQNGEFINTELDERVMGITAKDFVKIPRIVGVAGGKEKYNVIKAAIKGKLINVLITDKFIAQKLANEPN